MDARSRFKNFGGRVRERTTTVRAAVESLPSTPAVTTPHHAPHHAQPAHHVEPAPHAPKNPKKVGFFFGRRWMLVVIGVLVLLFGLMTYFYIDTKNELSKAKDNPDSAKQTELQKITSSVGKTIKLPAETPTLATVTNVQELKNQEFFKDAQNGDKVLIYTKSGRALLYRPSTKQVIEYARVNLGNQ